MKYQFLRYGFYFLFFVLLGSSLNTCQKSEISITVETPAMRMEFDEFLNTRLTSKLNDTDKFWNNFQPSSYLIVNDTALDSFKIYGTNVTAINDKTGMGRRTEIRGIARSNDYTVVKKVSVIAF